MKTSLKTRLWLAIEKKAKEAINFFGVGNTRFSLLLARINSYLKKHFQRNVSLQSVDVHLAEHCNLGCFSCNHFSPLAEEEFADLNITTRDLRRLSELTKGNVGIIYLVGGEPLLHPNIILFMQVARELFPDSDVHIITNGLLLLQQKPEFWEACKKYNIIMTPTKYPGVDWDKIEKRADEFGYKFTYFDFSGTSEKVSRRFALDLTGSQDMKKSYENCCMACCSIGLSDGRLSTCSFVFNMRHFNKYFKQNVPVTSADSIDIYKAKDIQEILDFLGNPIPLCRYCKSIGTEIVGEWRATKRELSEWT
ncbi:hypothetical protein RsTz2092_08550 [Deferribacterales bacterium RsTz2092]|nr:hypothetical protein AGMMS49941_03110 [Deferribacterales bacterium]